MSVQNICLQYAGKILEGRDHRTIPNTRAGWLWFVYLSLGNLQGWWFPTHKDDDSCGDLSQGCITLLGKKLFLSFGLNLPSHGFVYCPLLYHLQKAWLGLLHNCPLSTASHLHVSPQPPLHLIKQAQLLPPSYNYSNLRHDKMPIVLVGSFVEKRMAMNVEKSKLNPFESPSILLLSPSYFQNRKRGIRTPSSSAFYICVLFEVSYISSSWAEALLRQSFCWYIRDPAVFDPACFWRQRQSEHLHEWHAWSLVGNGMDRVGTAVFHDPAGQWQLWRNQDSPLPLEELCTEVHKGGRHSMAPQGLQCSASALAVSWFSTRVFGPEPFTAQGTFWRENLPLCWKISKIVCVLWLWED